MTLGLGAAGESGLVPSYETEAAVIHELVGQAVTLLLEDLANCVKQMVVQSECEFRHVCTDWGK